MKVFYTLDDVAKVDKLFVVCLVAKAFKLFFGLCSNLLIMQFLQERVWVSVESWVSIVAVFVSNSMIVPYCPMWFVLDLLERRSGVICDLSNPISCHFPFK